MFCPNYIPRMLLFILVLAAGIRASSQGQTIRFDHLSTEQGLSQSNVTCILRDSRGFMWFGTRDGLNRYDGYGFKLYKKIAGDPASLSSNYITHMVEDRKGGLWISTYGGGLNRYDQEKELFTHYEHDPKKLSSLSNDVINILMPDQAGNIWIGTDGGGMDILDPATGKFTNFSHNYLDAQSLSDNDVTDIVEDSQHRLWVGTFHGGLELFDRVHHSFTHFRHNEKDPASLSGDIISKVFEDSRHRLWVGTRGGGIDLFDPVQKKFRHFRNDPNNTNSLTFNMVISICEDDRARLWIGTENGGISILDPEKEIFQTYRHDDIDNKSLSNNSIYSIYNDGHGNMWVGTFSGGVDLFNTDANKFSAYRHTSSPQSLSNNNVLAIFEDSGNNLWVGTDGGGLELMDQRTGDFTHFKYNKSFEKGNINRNYVLSVCEDSEKNLWVGTWGDGLTVIDKGRGHSKQYKYNLQDTASLSSNNAFAIVQDRGKEIWVGTQGGGLNAYDRKSDGFRHFKHDPANPNSVSSDRIQTLMGDSKGYLWIGTVDGGLDLFDKRTNIFTHYLHENNRNSLSNNYVYCVFEDRQLNIWIGTADGLNLLDRKTGHFTAWSVKDGLPGATVFGILEDDKGNLWIATNKGLSRYTPGTRSFKNFSAADGLQSNEFKAHSCFKTSSGEMYFGGVHGFNKFFPDRIQANPFDPPLVITGFQLFNKEVGKNITGTKEITLSYKQSVFSFEFASLNYTIPEKKQYSYMLEGFDKKWNDIGMRRRATYTNLDAGKYIFKVRGLNNDGSWSPAVTGIQLIILPPFWLTWWFKLLVALCTAGCGIAFYRIRMRAVQAQKKDLERQLAVLDKAVRQGKFEVASDVLHDIGNAMVGFGSYLTRIKRLLEQDKPENLAKLAVFFKEQQPVMATAIGEAKAGAVATMLSGIAETQKATQEEIGRSITEQINTITHIQEILSIQRQYITGQETQERKPVNFRSIINDCLSMLFSSVDKKGIAVSLDIPTDLPLIKGDRTKLMQVILNLLKNSIEAIEMQDSEKAISLRVYSEPGLLNLEVRDSGVGFDKTTASHLFERGFTTQPSGSGLALYNCREILESHAGTIALTSEGPGKGALATIQFKI